MKHHYVYHSYEEWGREYIGRRTCNCPPEEDTKYFGSFKDKTFSPTEKTILFVCETRKEAAEIEIELHDFFDVAVNPKFANKAKATSTGFDRTGVPNTEETKKKISEAMSGEKNPSLGIRRSENTLQKMREAHIGNNHSENTKQKLRELNLGSKNPLYGKKRPDISERNTSRTGALHTKEAKQKMRNKKINSRWWVNPSGDTRFCFERPGSDWKLGRVYKI